MDPRVTIGVAGRPINFLLDTDAAYSMLTSYSGKPNITPWCFQPLNIILCTNLKKNFSHQTDRNVFNCYQDGFTFKFSENKTSCNCNTTQKCYRYYKNGTQSADICNGSLANAGPDASNCTLQSLNSSITCNTTLQAQTIQHWKRTIISPSTGKTRSHYPGCNTSALLLITNQLSHSSLEPPKPNDIYAYPKDLCS